MDVGEETIFLGWELLCVCVTVELVSSVNTTVHNNGMYKRNLFHAPSRLFLRYRVQDNTKIILTPSPRPWEW